MATTLAVTSATLTILGSTADGKAIYDIAKETTSLAAAVASVMEQAWKGRVIPPAVQGIVNAWNEVLNLSTDLLKNDHIRDVFDDSVLTELYESIAELAERVNKLLTGASRQNFVVYYMSIFKGNYEATRRLSNDLLIFKLTLTVKSTELYLWTWRSQKSNQSPASNGLPSGATSHAFPTDVTAALSAMPEDTGLPVVRSRIDSIISLASSVGVLPMPSDMSPSHLISDTASQRSFVLVEGPQQPHNADAKQPDNADTFLLVEADGDDVPRTTSSAAHGPLTHDSGHAHHRHRSPPASPVELENDPLPATNGDILLTDLSRPPVVYEASRTQTVASCDAVDEPSSVPLGGGEPDEASSE